MYSNDLSKEALLSEGACGILPSTGIPMPGLVPKVSIGAMSAASKWCSSSKTASASEKSVCQYFSDFSQASPCGANSLPRTYSKVVSSGAMRPPRAPISMLMLQMVMRASMLRLRMALPAYSTKKPVAPAALSWAMMCKMMSLAETPAANSPSTEMRMRLGLFCNKHWAASTCSTWLVPMPKAMAPKAPCVEV